MKIDVIFDDKFENFNNNEEGDMFNNVNSIRLGL